MTRTSSKKIPDRLAVVDLGSNSFRLEIGVFQHGEYRRTEYLKETVRQGGGLDEERNLTPKAMQAGWSCLARFGERLAGFQPHEVRAVATQTLREARNRDAFLKHANEVLGFPIEVISGQEEARMIYQGVARMLPPSNEKRLVVDIGGRSTELIIGSGMDPLSLESYRVGSIAWSKRYFPDGVFTERAFENAEVAAKAVLDEALDTYGSSSWDTAYGSAGTIGAICDVLTAAGWTPGVVTMDALDWIKDRLLAAQTADRLRIAGMREDRKAIIGGGVSVMRAVFSLLGVNTMHQASGGLRHGLVCDVLGESEHAFDMQNKAVERLGTKFSIDKAHGQRVANVATQLLRQMSQQIEAPEDTDWDHLELKLQWAAQLHEIGVLISHSDHHKHGAYILDNADASGFSITEMHRLSLLVLGHRGKLRKIEAELTDAGVIAQLMALRLAIILCHARRDPDIQGLKLQLMDDEGHGWKLTCRAGWERSFPQSAHLLREEINSWQKTPWTFEFALASKADLATAR